MDKMPLRVFKHNILQPQSKCLSLSKNSLNDQKEGVWLNNRGKEPIISKMKFFKNQKLCPKAQTTKSICRNIINSIKTDSEKQAAKDMEIVNIVSLKIMKTKHPSQVCRGDKMSELWKKHRRMLWA